MDHKKHLARAREIASILDTKFHFGKIKFGLDPLLSIVPGLGSVIGALTSTYVFWIAYNLKVPFFVYIKMAFNIIIDFLIGEIPVVGVFVDVFYRSNTRNIELLEKHLKPEVVDAEIVGS
jgi:hypothetical protein